MRHHEYPRSPESARNAEDGEQYVTTETKEITQFCKRVFPRRLAQYHVTTEVRTQFFRRPFVNMEKMKCRPVILGAARLTILTVKPLSLEERLGPSGCCFFFGRAWRVTLLAVSDRTSSPSQLADQVRSRYSPSCTHVMKFFIEFAHRAHRHFLAAGMIPSTIVRFPCTHFLPTIIGNAPRENSVFYGALVRAVV